MFEVRIFPKAEKQIKQIKKIYQASILSALEELKDDPFTGKSLTRELTGKYSYKIDTYRIIYKVNKKDKIINILSAGHRSTIYE